MYNRYIDRLKNNYLGEEWFAMTPSGRYVCNWRKRSVNNVLEQGKWKLILKRKPKNCIWRRSLLFSDVSHDYEWDHLFTGNEHFVVNRRDPERVVMPPISFRLNPSSIRLTMEMLGWFGQLTKRTVINKQVRRLIRGVFVPDTQYLMPLITLSFSQEPQPQLEISHRDTRSSWSEVIWISDRRLNSGRTDIAPAVPALNYENIGSCCGINELTRLAVMLFGSFHKVHRFDYVWWMLKITIQALI